MMEAWVGIVGVVIGAVLGFVSNSIVAARHERLQARKKFEAYSYALNAYINELLDHTNDDFCTIAQGSFQDVVAAHKAVYSYAGYIKDKALRRRLILSPEVRRPDPGSQGEKFSEELAAAVAAVADELETFLDTRFPKRGA